jgi:hypothetical protein
VLQIPWLLDRAYRPQPEESRIMNSIRAVIDAPGQAIHPRAGAVYVARSLHFNVISPFGSEPLTVWVFGAALVAGAIASALLMPDTRIAVLTTGPLLAAVAMFAFWQGPLEEVYWCLVLTPAAAIAMLAWIDRLEPRAALAGTIVATALVLAAQPGRAQMAWSFHRLPQYGAIVRGCRSIASRGVTVRAIQPTFDVPADMNATWLCSIAGARVTADPGSPLALINAAGVTTFR